jgi:hypothetical protein
MQTLRTPQAVLVNFKVYARIVIASSSGMGRGKANA